MSKNEITSDKPVIIQVHPLLLEEFKYLKEKLEKELGYKIYGGMPIISKIIGMQLKEQRIKNKNSLEIISTKVKGSKKVKFCF